MEYFLSWESVTSVIEVRPPVKGGDVSREINIMSASLRWNGHTLVMLLGLALALPAAADKPSWASRGKHGSGERFERHYERNSNRRHDRDSQVERTRGSFIERDREAIRKYYVAGYLWGDCPPGLAKKHNGCMPPGQAKKWPVGAPLPRDVVYYELPPTLVVKLGAPPSGYQYVRVASDILLISLGSRMVIDAVRDLGGI